MVSANIPRIVVAGTQSGVGKTSMTLGLVAALRRRGLRVQTFKAGPDYLDPTYLAIASGRPCYNLDGWMTGADYVRELFCRVCVDADVAVVEGVMGLFDGADPATLEGSTAEIALWIEAPVVLVVDAHGMSRSFAAAVHGFSSFIPEVRVGGVIANRCGSERHAQWLSESLKSAALPPLLGAVRRGALPELRSRHLGLVTADPERLQEETLNKLADAVESAVSLDELLQTARNAKAFSRTKARRHEGENTDPDSQSTIYHPPSTPDSPVSEELLTRRRKDAKTSFGSASLPASRGSAGASPSHLRSTIHDPQFTSASPRSALRLGLARDEAFHFYYPDNLDALEREGCELVPFSPLRDQVLPAGLHGLYIGGGYPEAHAEALAANSGMLDAIRQFSAGGGVIYGECGGLMYLSEGIEALDGKRHRLLGLLPAWTRMREKRQSLGYVEVTLTRDCLLGRTGERLRGHEFHYSELIGVPEGWETAYELRYRRSDNTVAEGFQRGSVLASYAHIHFASQPRAVAHFVNCLKEYKP